MDFKKIFDEYRTIAVVGMSKNSQKAAGSIPLILKNQGYSVIPVNPSADEIAGMKCYDNLLEIPENIDIVNIFRPSEDALDIVKNAIERFKIRKDIKLIWLQEGIINSEAQKLAEDAGIEFLQDHCIYKEYNKLF